MGFCLFEHADMRGIYFAVNAAHVLDVELSDKTSFERPVSLIRCDFGSDGIEALAVGGVDEVHSLLKDASKIGVNKAEIHILSGRERVKLTPLVFNYADQVVLITEMLGDAVPESDGEFVTASQMFMGSGSVKMMVERPGVFARQINAQGRVPILQV